MRRLSISVVVLLLAGAALAVTPGTELYLPSVGHGTGTGGSQWRTDVWVYNPGTTGATVTIYFLERLTQNPAPLHSEPITVAPGETKEYVDIILSLFNRDGKYGALRFVADREVVVTGRIYDANVQVQGKTVKGSAGQFFAGLPGSAAIGINETTDIVGLAQDAASPQHWRSNFGFVETTGNSATYKVEQLDASGVVVGTKTYPALGAYGAAQVAITDIANKLGSNQRLRVTVTAGTGKVLAFGSRIDSYTGDPSTVEMTIAATGGAAHTTGRFDGTVTVTDASGERVDGGLRLTLTTAAVTDYAGVAGILCGSIPYTLDFSPDAGLAASISNDAFTAPAVSIPYEDTPGHTIFTTQWTLTGTRASDGTWTGTLTSVTSGGVAPDWDDCNGTVQHDWRAAWSGNS